MARPRKPVEQHIAQGSYRKDRHDQPQVSLQLAQSTVVAPPKGIPRELNATWKVTVRDLLTMGILIEPDLPILLEAFVHLGQARRIQKELDRLNKKRTWDEDDVDLMAKLVSAEAKVSAAWSTAMGRFGITPSERAKILHSLPKPPSAGVKSAKKRSISQIIAK